MKAFKLIHLARIAREKNMNFFYTYVLMSKKDNRLYIGWTNDLESRYKKHREGRVVATKNRQPLSLIYFEACLSKADALKREAYFKTGFGRRYLRNRLTGSRGGRATCA